MIRLYLSDLDIVLSQGAEVRLSQEQSRYLSGVMRKSLGDSVLVFNGREGEFEAHIAHIAKKSVTLCLGQQTKTQPALVGPTLLVALIKRTRLETIIEKATELGVGCIQLLITHRTVGDHTNLARLQTIATEAAEQTERLDVPKVLAPQKLDSYLERHSEGTIIYGEENSTHDDFGPVPTLLDVLLGTQSAAPFSALIGPEGGFDDQERLILQANPHCVAVNLGPRILRADTAAISALTLIQAVAGDWKKSVPKL